MSRLTNGLSCYQYELKTFTDKSTVTSTMISRVNPFAINIFNKKDNPFEFKVYTPVAVWRFKSVK